MYVWAWCVCVHGVCARGAYVCVCVCVCVCACVHVCMCVSELIPTDGPTHMKYTHNHWSNIAWAYSNRVHCKHQVLFFKKDSYVKTPYAFI